MGKTTRLTTSEFIIGAKKVHGDKYDYSLVEYKNAHTKVDIICPEHGVFKQKPNDHKNNHGCPNCPNNLGVNKFIDKSRIVHGEKYDYSLVEYKNNNTKVKITCPEHGMFEQIPMSHLKGNGCYECFKYEKLLKKEVFIQRSNEVHNNKYDYSLVEYKDKNTKVSIICKKHGIFKQGRLSHLKGSGCPSCKESKGESVVRSYLKNENINYIVQKTFKKCKDRIPLKFDFYLPEYNMCIEYDGIQHFEPVDFFGGNKTLEETIKRDNIKNEYCKDNNIRLLRIKYTDNINSVLEKTLINIL